MGNAPNPTASRLRKRSQIEQDLLPLGTADLVRFEGLEDVSGSDPDGKRSVPEAVRFLLDTVPQSNPVL